MIKAASILNIGLINAEICSQVKRQLLAEGWIFTTEEENGLVTVTAYESKEEKEEGQYMNRYTGTKYDAVLKEVLQNCQNYYKRAGEYDKK